ncbi:MAG: hypothetical protein LBL53_00975 [Endomicrobium sp.]|jgi:predicted HicB family RNase H-like nuclease|nr:hypothetical protein [Endomicrobium sp.]
MLKKKKVKIRKQSKKININYNKKLVNNNKLIIDTHKPETKTKRFNMLLKLSLFNNLKSFANKLGISINDLAHQVLNDFISKRK